MNHDSEMSPELAKIRKEGKLSQQMYFLDGVVYVVVWEVGGVRLITPQVAIVTVADMVCFAAMLVTILQNQVKAAFGVPGRVQ